MAGKSTRESGENLLKLDGLLSMGYGIIPKRAMRDKRLTPEAKAIYAYLCSFAGSGNTAFPSVALICDEIGMSEDRFYRHRKMLVDCGYIHIEQIRGGRGKTGNNIYTILHSVPENVAHPQNKGPQNRHPQNKGPQNKGTQNKGSINNSSTNNSLINNILEEKQDIGGKPQSLFPDENKAKKTRKKPDARPESIEEVQTYIEKMGYDQEPVNLTAEEFMDANEMRGWKTKGGQAIQDWKACVRVFARNRKQWHKTDGAKRGETPASKANVVIREEQPQKWGLFDD